MACLQAGKKPGNCSIDIKLDRDREAQSDYM
jgi:hypothetical protein